MRDPARIEITLSLINQIWQQQPDLRFQQLIYTLQSRFSLQNNNVGKIELVEEDGFIKVGYDLFNIEDNLFVKFLEEIVKNGL